MKRGLFFPCLLLVSWIAGSISCSSPVSQKTDWRQRIDSVARINYNLAFGYPDSVRQILSHLPIPAEDSINQYYLYLHYGRCYYLNDQMDSTLACMSIVENFCKRNPFSPSIHSLLAGAYNIRAVVYLTRNERKDALSYLNLAYQHIQQADIRREMPNICVNAADICRQMGKLPQATAWYRRAMVAADSLQMPEMMHCIHTGLGLIYADLNNFEKAHFYLSIADTLYPPQTPYESYYFYNTRSNCYTFENKHLQALECSRKAYEFAKEIKQDLARATAEANIGETFLALGNIDSARYYLDLASKYYFVSPDADTSIRFFIKGIYASIALAENDLAKANRILSEPYDPSVIGAAYLYLHNKRLMEYYTKISDFKKANQYQKLVTLYDDSLRNSRYQNSIAEIDMRYRQDTALLRRDIVIANTNSRVSDLQSTVTLTISLLVLTLIVVLSIYSYIRRRNERKRREQLSLITKLRMENVRNRFSPHFVFNVLNAVIGSLSREESKALPLRLLIQVLRSNLLISDKIAIPLHEEIELVKSYAGLRQSTNPATPTVEWNISPDINLDLLLPAMIIQIPVENALKHAFPSTYNSDETPLVSIQIIPKGNGYTLIIIEDNGIGYIPGAKPSDRLHSNDTGTGIHILFRTVELLNLKNIHKMTFEITDRSVNQTEAHGTRVTILIPSIYNYNS